MEGLKKNKKVRRILLRWTRVAVQAAAFFLAPSLFTQAFGAVKVAAEAMGKGGVLPVSAFVVRLGILCGITFVFGRVFCGWACAFGAVNDWVYKLSFFLRKMLGKKLPQIPGTWRRALQKLKYAVLLLVLVCCFFGKSEWVTKYSPWTVFSLLVARNLKLTGYGPAIFLWACLLFGMALEERFFCQFFCPMGAVFSLLPELPLLALHRDEKNCIPGCNGCQRNCPVHIKLGEDSLQSGECIRCGRCMTVCPKGNIGIRKP